MPVCGRNLILAVGGDLRPGEKLKGYIRRVAVTSGIGFRSAEAAWKQQYVSKNTALALRKTAQEKAKNEDDELISRVETWIANWEAIDSHYFGPDIDAGREFVARMHRMAETRSRVAVRLWSEEAAEKE